MIKQTINDVVKKMVSAGQIKPETLQKIEEEAKANREKLLRERKKS